MHLSSPVKFWEGLLRAIGREDLAADPRFLTRADRFRAYAALEKELQAVFIGGTQAEWCARLAAEDVPHAPVLGLDEVLRSPQALHLGIEQRSIHPVEGEVRTIANPVIYDRMRSATFVAPPTLDEHGPSLRARFRDRS